MACCGFGGTCKLCFSLEDYLGDTPDCSFSMLFLECYVIGQQELIQVSRKDSALKATAAATLPGQIDNIRTCSVILDSVADSHLYKVDHGAQLPD